MRAEMLPSAGRIGTVGGTGLAIPFSVAGGGCS
uniref:Uncharacterized protein n=1 Tax=Anguilla anguilla TaxID=7936 RepID=A0A0E9PJE1_ANGAN